MNIKKIINFAFLAIFFVFFVGCIGEEISNRTEVGGTDINVSSVGNVEGSIVDFSTDNLLTGVTVKIGGKSDTTGDDGVYTIKTLDIGMRSITVNKAGYQVYSGTIEVKKGYTVNHNISLVFDENNNIIVANASSQDIKADDEIMWFIKITSPLGFKIKQYEDLSFKTQFELSQLAAKFAFSPEGWGLGDRKDSYVYNISENPITGNGVWENPIYVIVVPEDESNDFDFEPTPKNMEKRKRYLAFHVDADTSRGSHDICENSNNFGIISGYSDGEMMQCVIENWGTYLIENTKELSDRNNFSETSQLIEIN